MLGVAQAPRWSLRAVRLACQSVLAGRQNTEETWARLQSTFIGLATEHGQRWAEVPLEAILTLGSSEEAFARVWPKLLAEKAVGLRTLLRLALQRHAEGGIGDSAVLGPVVALTFCGNGSPARTITTTAETPESKSASWCWLGYAVWSCPMLVTLTLRQQVRDRLLAGDLVPHDKFAVEALAMLGPDLDERAETFLRRLAQKGGGHLAPAVESLGPEFAMSEHQPQLLITLTEAFYIKRYDGERFGWSYSGLDDGIRRHQRTGGFTAPMAAWYYGPFFRLLNTRPIETLALINRMLDHAAVCPCRQASTLGNWMAARRAAAWTRSRTSRRRRTSVHWRLPRLVLVPLFLGRSLPVHECPAGRRAIR